VIVRPYKRTPAPPTVALMLDTGAVVDEHGDRLDFDTWPAGTRVWASYDTVRNLVNAGRGEAVCWNGEEIHWRHARLDEDGWTPRGSDVHVLKLPFSDDRHELTIRALVRWRDWLASWGAAPSGTTGSAAWSLLRATLERDLFTSEPFKGCPPLRATIGGRQALGPGGKGVFAGRLEQWDLPAAYASELGELPYGGHWVRSGDLAGVERDPDWWAGENRPVFVRAVVSVPELELGPLPRRPRSRRSPQLVLGLGCEYPVATRLQGVWTWQEVLAAEAAGARVIKLLEVYGHFSGGRRPFERWWEAVQEGRRMPGLAGVLAKMTGNALWGRFCMDSRGGQRTIRSRGSRRMLSRAMVFRGGQPPAHDLAETVSGRVRARLYGAMADAGEQLVCAHTDGLWLRKSTLSTGLVDKGWRLKQSASRLEVLSPQVLRYWPRPAREDAPWVVFAGVPASEAYGAFREAWGRAGMETVAA